MDLFYNITDREKDRLLKLIEANTFTFKKDKIILSTISQENIIGIVISGIIQIVRNEYNGDRIIIEELGENSIFGSKISSINNSEYDIITKEDTKIIIMEYNRILSFNEFNYKFYNQFIKNLLLIISNKIEIKNERIEILTKRSIRNKLLEYFKITSKKNGSKIIYLPFNFTELADYLAVDRSAMSRELKNLKDEGFIKIDGRKITLLY